MRQDFWLGTSDDITFATENDQSPMGSFASWETTRDDVEVICPIAGQPQRAAAYISTAPGAPAQRHFRLRVNGATAQTLTIRDAFRGASHTILSGSVPIAAGDKIAFGSAETDTPAAVTWTAMGWSVEWDDRRFVWFGGSGPGGLNNAATEYYAPGCAHAGGHATEATVSVIVPFPCKLTDVAFDVNVVPGVGDSWAFSVMVNGSSVLTRTITDVSGDIVEALSAADAVNLDQGDTVSIEVTPTSAPAATAMSFGLAFDPFVDDQWALVGVTSTTLDAAAQEYLAFGMAHDLTLDGNADDIPGLVDPSSGQRISDLQVTLGGAPGAGTSYDFAMIVGGADDGNAFRDDDFSEIGANLNIANTDTEGYDRDVVAMLASFDKWQLTVKPVSTPAAQTVKFSAIAHGPPSWLRQVVKFSRPAVSTHGLVFSFQPLVPNSTVLWVMHTLATGFGSTYIPPNAGYELLHDVENGTELEETAEIHTFARLGLGGTVLVNVTAADTVVAIGFELVGIDLRPLSRTTQGRATGQTATSFGNPGGEHSISIGSVSHIGASPTEFTSLGADRPAGIVANVRSGGGPSLSVVLKEFFEQTGTADLALGWTNATTRMTLFSSYPIRSDVRRPGARQAISGVGQMAGSSPVSLDTRMAAG